MTKEKLYQKAYAWELLKIAAGDLDSAEVLATMFEKGRKENICYAAEQAIEKAIKAVICAQGQAIPMTYSIELLLNKLTTSPPPHGEVLAELTDYATIKRYQEGSEVITREDISAVIKAGGDVIKWAEREITILLST